MQVFGSNDDFFGLPQGGDVCQKGQAKPMGMFVGQDEKFVVGALGYGLFQAFRGVFAENDFLFVHDV